ncbi:6315_t:CDS:2 [Acaulospora morrowiae]|uniref:6315_t:CDS:1 n=1 Tax=Acaulospora morrowiae TaxID=94023 RepID=A0A9N8VUA6_9GLOM|nr:6315_t:CDS:2 [Acaulospora morrowiae]
MQEIEFIPTIDVLQSITENCPECYSHQKENLLVDARLYVGLVLSEFKLRRSDNLVPPQSFASNFLLIMSRIGYWQTTSSVDWCENNYEYSHYIAEFWNTFSSLAMIIFGEAGARMNLCEGFRFKLAFRLISVVGVGSLLFHATLTSEMQALDEVPMVWSALTLVHPLIESIYGPQGYWLPIAQVIHAILCTLAVTIAKGDMQFIFFHMSFGSLELLSLYLMHRIYSLKKSSHPAVKYLFERGVIIYSLAIAIWLTDLYMCDYVNGGEKSILPFNPQLHSIWHLLASFGLYLLVVLTLYNFLWESGVKCNVVYRFGGLVPVVVKNSLSFKDVKKLERSKPRKNSFISIYSREF